MSYSVLLVYFLLVAQVIFCFESHHNLPFSSATTSVNSTSIDDLTFGVPCQTFLLYLEILCGVLLITVVAESSALLIIYCRRRRQHVSDKKPKSGTETDEYQEYEENSTDYETLSNDYKPIPPPLATMPRTRRVTPKGDRMCEIQHTPIQITGSCEDLPHSFGITSTQTLPLPVWCDRMLPPAPRSPMMPQGPRIPMLPQGPRIPILPQGPRTPMLPQGPRTPMLPQGPCDPMLSQGPRNPMLPQGPRNPMLSQSPRSPVLPQTARNPVLSQSRSPIQSRLPPQALRLPLPPQSQSPTPGKLHLPASSPQIPPASSKHCNPKRPPAPLPKDINTHAEKSTPKMVRKPPNQSDYSTDASDDEWTFETIYY